MKIYKTFADLSPEDYRKCQLICLGESEKELWEDYDLYEKLYEIFFNMNEMPYGTLKGRDGDPMDWIAENLPNYIDYPEELV